MKERHEKTILWFIDEVVQESLKTARLFVRWWECASVPACFGTQPGVSSVRRNSRSELHLRARSQRDSPVISIIVIMQIMTSLGLIDATSQEHDSTGSALCIAASVVRLRL